MRMEVPRRPKRHKIAPRMTGFRQVSIRLGKPLLSPCGGKLKRLISKPLVSLGSYIEGKQLIFTASGKSS